MNDDLLDIFLAGVGNGGPDEDADDADVDPVDDGDDGSAAADTDDDADDADGSDDAGDGGDGEGEPADKEDPVEARLKKLEADNEVLRNQLARPDADVSRQTLTPYQQAKKEIDAKYLAGEVSAEDYQDAINERALSIVDERNIERQIEMALPQHVAANTAYFKDEANFPLPEITENAEQIGKDYTEVLRRFGPAGFGIGDPKEVDNARGYAYLLSLGMQKAREIAAAKESKTKAAAEGGEPLDAGKRKEPVAGGAGAKTLYSIKGSENKENRAFLKELADKRNDGKALTDKQMKGIDPLADGNRTEVLSLL